MVQNTDGSVGPTDAEIELQLRQLALVDRVLGLEAEVARLSATNPVANGSRDEVARIEGELRAVYGSRTWRIGSAMLAPLRKIRSLGSR